MDGDISLEVIQVGSPIRKKMSITSTLNPSRTTERFPMFPFNISPPPITEAGDILAYGSI